MVFDRMVKSEIDHVENSIPTHCSGYSFIQKSAISSFFAEITIFFQNLSGNRVSDHIYIRLQNESKRKSRPFLLCYVAAEKRAGISDPVKIRVL